MSIIDIKLNKKIITLSILAVVIAVIVVYAINLTNNENKMSTSEVKSITNKVVNDCKDDMHCVVKSLTVISKNENQELTLQSFSELIKLFEKNYPCHETAHHMGMWLYGYLGDLKKSLQLAEQKCGGAIFHGVIQNYLSSQHFENNPPGNINLKTICIRDSQNQYSIEQWQCLHGIGHGLATVYNYDVFSALKRCDEFEPGWEQISCSKGVFMQNVVKYVESRNGTFDKNDRFYPCNKVGEKYAPSCYHYHATYLGLQNDARLLATFRDCDKIIPEEFVRYCYYGMGRELADDLSGSVDNALFLCTSNPNEQYHSFCLKGMLMTQVNLNKDPQIGFEFCKSLPEKFKSDCYDGLGMWIIMVRDTPQERDQLCSRAETQYSQICKNATLENITLL